MTAAKMMKRNPSPKAGTKLTVVTARAMPATAARKPLRNQVSMVILSTSMPLTLARTESSDMARIAFPTVVRVSSTWIATMTATATPITINWYEVNKNGPRWRGPGLGRLKVWYSGPQIAWMRLSRTRLRPNVTMSRKKSADPRRVNGRITTRSATTANTPMHRAAITAATMKLTPHPELICQTRYAPRVRKAPYAKLT